MNAVGNPHKDVALTLCQGNAAGGASSQSMVRPGIELARGFSSRPLPLGLNGHFALLGGERLGPNGIAADLALDWHPEFMRAVTQACDDLRIGGCPWFTMPPILLAGPAGVGRTHIARRLATSAGLPHFVLDAAVDATFDPTAAPNVLLPLPPIVGMALTRCANPIVSVVNIERASTIALQAITRLVDLRVSRRYVDEGLGATLDLGAVNWLVHATEPNNLPIELASALLRVDLAMPEGQHFEIHIVDLVAEAVADLGVPAPDHEALMKMIDQLTQCGIGDSTRHASNLSSAIRMWLRSETTSIPQIT